MVHRRVDHLAELEAEQNALLYPGVDAPSAWTRGVGFRGADGSGGQRLAQTRKRLAGGVAVRRRAVGDEFSDVVFEAQTSAPLSKSSSLSTFTIRSLDSAFGETIGSR